MGQNSLSFLAPKEWNKFPKEIKEAKYKTVKKQNNIIYREY